MARSPGGKSVGRVSIRVIPDTSRFREDLKTALERIERGEGVRINAELAAREKFHRDVQSLISNAESNKVNLDVALSSALASARLARIARPRIVPLHVRVSRASQVVAENAIVQMIARLTGLRSAGSFVERFFESFGNLDKALPRIALLTTGISSLVSVLLSAVSGLLGIGAGLSAILPALLVLPGLFAGAVVSVALLAVALADARQQLAVLAPSMRELGTLIQDSFWAEARSPIIELISNLLPQLRASFGATSTAIGGFVGDLASSFDREFAGGRFEAAFAGLPATFKELSRGTDAFAGAIVSLGLVAARYVPRLARWFVDLSIRFDTFLKQTAEDGRLDEWIEGAIKAMNDLWRATAATGSALAGLWRAAEAAGGGGLSGFADQMERIDRVINGSAFQRTMTAVFRGANTATAAIGRGLREVGLLLEARRRDVEFFLGTAGDALGRLIGDAAQALNTPEVGGAVRDFISGIDRGLAGFGRYLPDVAAAAASLLSFAGTFAETLGPTLGSAAAAVGGLLKPILDTLNNGTLQSLGATIKAALDELGPTLAAVGETLAPMIAALVDLVERGIPMLAGAVGELLGGFATNTPDERDPSSGPLNGLGELIRGTNIFTALQGINDALEGQNSFVNALRGNYGVMWQEIATAAWATANQLYNAWQSAYVAAATWVNQTASNISTTFVRIRDIVTGIVGQIGASIASIPDTVARTFAAAGSWLYDAGRQMMQGFVNGIISMVTTIAQTSANAALGALNAAKKALGIKSPSTKAYNDLGVPTIQGWVNAIRDNAHLVSEEMVRAAALPTLPDVDVGALGSRVADAVAAFGNTVNLTVNNPVGVPTEESVRRHSQLIGAGLAV